jgi:hypothetical protein
MVSIVEVEIFGFLPFSNWPDFDQKWSNLGQIWVNFGQKGPFLNFPKKCENVIFFSTPETRLGTKN